MKNFFKYLIIILSVFCSLSSPHVVHATLDLDDMRGFETLTQIPSHANPLAGLALLHMIPNYLAALTMAKTPATKKFLDKLFICPNAEISIAHILPRAGTYQIANFLTPEIVGAFVATLNFYQKQRSCNQHKDLKSVLLEIFKGCLDSGELLKKGRLFVNTLINALSECSFFNDDQQFEAPFFQNFVTQSLIAFMCLTSKKKEDVEKYCNTYQLKTNALQKADNPIELPSLSGPAEKSQNTLRMWKARNVALNQQKFINSLLLFLKSTVNEIIQCIEIPDVTTRGTSYPVCMETVLHGLTRFISRNPKSTIRTNQNIIDFFATSAKSDLEQQIIDFSSMINNLPYIVYGIIIKNDKSIIDRNTNIFNLDKKIDGFFHIDLPATGENIKRFFAHRQDFEFIKEQDGISFINLNNKIFGVYNTSHYYGLRIRAKMSNILGCLAKLFDLSLDDHRSSLLICNELTSLQIFTSQIVPQLDLTFDVKACEDDGEIIVIALENSLGGIFLSLTECHSFVTYTTNKSRLFGKANSFSSEILQEYYIQDSSEYSSKLFMLLTSLAPWSLSRLIIQPLGKNSQIIRRLEKNGSELSCSLARHLYLGQEINDDTCFESIIDILGHNNGDRLSDVVHFLCKSMSKKPQSVGEAMLKKACLESPWLAGNLELEADIKALFTT